MNYRLTIYGNNMYKEIVLDEQFEGELTMGTQKECQICFQRERFLTDFEIRIHKQGEGNYTVSCTNTVFFKQKDGLKEYVNHLLAGDKLTICYSEDEREFFYLDFSLDFPIVGDDFEQVVDCDGISEITIGGTPNSLIRIDDATLSSDCVILRHKGNYYEIDNTFAPYGICVNGVSVRNKVTNIRNGEFFSIKGYRFYLKDCKLYTTTSAKIITRIPIHTLSDPKNCLSYPKFKRNVRQRYIVPGQEEVCEILKPKEKENQQEQNILLTFMPMIANFLLMIVLRGMMGGNKSFVLYFAGTMIVSSSVSVFTFINQKKKHAEKEKKRKEVYMDYLNEKEKKIIELRQQEQTIANQMNPTLSQYIEFVHDFDSRLFEKEKTHEDYLAVRLGSGIVPSSCQVEAAEDEYVETEDELAEFPNYIREKYEYLEEMPILLQLKNTNAVGFVGNRTKLYQIEKNLIVSFAASHFYKDLKLFLIMDEDDVQLFQWARWFQNTYNDNTSTRNFMYDKESAKISLEFLYSELSKRESMRDVSELEDYIVFVYKSEIISDHPVSEYVKKANSLGFHFIFFEEYEELLHCECTKRIFLNPDDYTGYIQDVQNGKNIQEFYYSHITLEEAQEAAMKLACVYVDEVSLENSLTKNISLFELLKIMTPYDLDLKERWGNSKIYESMSAPLGVKSGNEVVSLDLHEKYHGPHGLVAGTTGSGKSEIMQSYILSVATLFHPYEVGFIIIDFKGGGMANQFRELPHLIGTITNIDGKEIDRSLLSIKAELIKRQELFAEQDVNHIDDYIKAYKSGEAKVPLPHLILIVDEFAELKSDQPEFMKELISAARIGRSLGVHLILATQKPSGVVNEQIWSNSKFKLCLKVQNKGDSNEVLKSPLAAEIREPGRAYLQVGNNEIFQLFQSAYSGAPARNDEISNQKKFRIYNVELSGKRSLVYEQLPKKAEESETQLDAIVNYINEYCKKNKINRLPSICLPPLPMLLDYQLDDYKRGESDISIPIGLADNPSRQEQFVEELNFSQNNIIIMGSSLSGKTCMLQSIIYGLTQMYSPNEVNLYLLDFASMILKNFENLAHVGGVITSSDDEKLKKFIDIISNMVQTRKSILSQKGLSSYRAYLESGEGDMPQIVVMIDNWLSFKNYFPEYEDIIINLVRDSVAVGISFVITAAQYSGIGFKLISSFSKRIALYCNDSSEYASLIEGCRIKLDNIPGRGIAEINRSLYECQYYLAFAADKEFQRVQMIKNYIQEVNNKYKDCMVKGIPEVPEVVTEEFVKKQICNEDIKPYYVPLGMDYETMKIETISLLKSPFISVVGDGKKSRIDYIKFFISYLCKQNVSAPVELYLLDDEQQTYRGFEKDAVIYTTQKNDASEILDIVHKKLENRTENMTAQDALQLVVINTMDAVEVLTENKENEEKLDDIYNQYRNLKVCFLYTNIKNASISFSASNIMKKIRDEKRFILFEDIKEINIVDIPFAIAREYRKNIGSTDAYYVDDNYFVKLKMVTK